MLDRLTCYYFNPSNKEEQAEAFIQGIYKLTGIEGRYKIIIDESKDYAEFILIK